MGCLALYIHLFCFYHFNWFFAGFSALDATGIGGALFSWSLSFTFFMLWIYLTVKIIRHKKQFKRDL
jgi:hypothetical protein